MKSMYSRTRIVLTIIVALAGPSLAHAYLVDEWYIVQMQGQRAGWMHLRESDPGYGYITQSQVHLEIARGGATIAIDLQGSFTETYDGRPFEMTSVQALGANPVTTVYRFEKDKITATVKQNGQSTISRLDPVRGDWLTPAAARRFLVRQIKTGATEFQYTTIDPMGGLIPLRIKTTVVGPTTIDAVGKTLPAIEWKTEQSASPGVVTTEYVSNNATPIRTELSLGAIDFVVIKSERELAQADISPTEIMISTFVTPSRAIAAPRSLRSASYILSVEQGAIGDIPATSAQSVERIDQQHVRVTIRADKPTPADPSASKEPRYRTGPAMLDWRDKKVEAVADAALHKNLKQPQPKMAETLRRAVHHYITEKNLDVGFASASEVCRTRQGDCTEHATLLAALLRYVGIPSRVAGGLIYAESFAGRSRIFGYHMWTQALLADDAGVYRWVDLDATLADQTPFDATHIALSLSSMSDDETINSMASLAPMLGRVQIDVEHTGDESPQKKNTP